MFDAPKAAGNALGYVTNDDLDYRETIKYAGAEDYRQAE